MSQPNPCLQAALEYLKSGWSPLALCPPSHAGCSQTHIRTCTKPGKRPLGEWKEFQKRLATEDEVRKWWKDTPQANVGIATGEVSGVIGIDVDGIAGEEWLHEIAADDVPKTVTFNTGKEDSYRYFYALPAGHPCPTICFANVDGSEPLKFLGNGAQTVMPPSRHILGTRYCWVTQRSPSECKVAPAPRWLLKRLKDKAEGKSDKFEKTAPTIADGEIVNEGGRNAYLMRIAGAMRRHACSQVEIYEAIKVVNQHRCDPPLSDIEVAGIARNVMQYAPTEVPPSRVLDKKSDQKPGAFVHVMDGVPEEKLCWMWPRWMPEGCLVCLDGDGGTGKSSMLVDLAARLSRGDAMPDGSYPTGWKGPANTLMVCCEDSLRAVIKPRVVAAKADQTRVFYLEEVYDPQTKGPRLFDLQRDTGALEEAVRAHRIRFVFIDPILAFLGDADYSKDPEVRRTLNPLKRIAEVYKCTICYIRHWNKGSVGQKASYRGGGALTFVNQARIGITVGHHPEDENKSVAAVSKGNYSKHRKGLMFQVVEVPGKEGIGSIRWLGETSLTANQLTEVQEEYEKDKTESAKDWLEALLEDGETEAREVIRRAKKADISERTLYRAKNRLGVISRKVRTYGKSNYSVWELPERSNQAASPEEAGGEGPEVGDEASGDADVAQPPE